MVEYLEIKGKQYPVRIGYWVMKQVKAKTGKSIGQAMKEVREDLSVHETILYEALRMGNYAENGSLDIDLDREEMPMILDLVFADYFKLFTSDSFFPKEAVQKGQERLGEIEEAEQAMEKAEKQFQRTN